jgi:hypothetical protein
MNEQNLFSRIYKKFGKLGGLSVVTFAVLLSSFDLQAAVPWWPAGNGIGNQDSSAQTFAGSGVAQAAVVDTTIQVTNLMWFCTSDKVAGTPRFTYINAVTDQGYTNYLRFFISTNSTTLTNAAAANTTNGLNVASTNGFVKGDFLLYSTGTNDAYQFLVVSNFLSAGNTIFTYQTYSNNLGPGDKVYKMTLAGAYTQPTLPGSTNNLAGIGTAQTLAHPGGIFTGPEGKPCMVQCVGTATALNALTVAGDYYIRLRR